MNYFDNAFEKAKEALEVVSKKTGEVLSTQKQKFNIASLENKRSKDFEKLGEIYYNLIKDTEIDDEKIKTLVESINAKDDEIHRLKDELNNSAL